MLGGGAMNDISLTILPETQGDAAAIERLHERTFGPGRYAKTAYRLREQVGHKLDRVVHRAHRHAAGRLGAAFPVRIGETKALLLGPLTVEPPFRERGVGQALIGRALEEGARQRPQAGDPGRRRAVLRQVRLQARSARTRDHAGPVDPARLLVAELAEAPLTASRDRSGRIGKSSPLAALARPGAGETAEQQQRPSRPAKTGSTPMPRTTLASRIFRPIQSSPL
jgi:predicted N-acetyltransferase YhbS